LIPLNKASNGQFNTYIDLDIKTVGGETALYKAVWNLRADCLDILLQCGADPTIESLDGESIFQVAE